MTEQAKGKVTPAMKKWCRVARRNKGGEIHFPRPNYDIAGRMRDLGLFEIRKKDGTSGWPYAGWYMVLTDEGRKYGGLIGNG